MSTPSSEVRLIEKSPSTRSAVSVAAFARARCPSSALRRMPDPRRLRETNGRHRLNRGGNRQANAALYRAIVVRMRWHPPTIAYVERRTGEGPSKREIIRCLKRYLTREFLCLLPAPSSSAELASAA